MHVTFTLGVSHTRAVVIVRGCQFMGFVAGMFASLTLRTRTFGACSGSPLSSRASLVITPCWITPFMFIGHTYADPSRVQTYFLFNQAVSMSTFLTCITRLLRGDVQHGYSEPKAAHKAPSCNLRAKLRRFGCALSPCFMQDG